MFGFSKLSDGALKTIKAVSVIGSALLGIGASLAGLEEGGRSTRRMEAAVRRESEKAARTEAQSWLEAFMEKFSGKEDEEAP